MVESTAGGGGNFVVPKTSDAIHQVARNTAKDKRRSTLVSRRRLIESAGLELRRGPHQFASADLSQHAIEHAGIDFLVG